jgi:hypothetical protein
VLVAIIWTVLGSASLAGTLFGIWRGGVYSPLPLISVVLAFLAVQKIPDWLPSSYAIEADIHYQGYVRDSLRGWYENHQQFPRDRAEFENAISNAPASPYAQQGGPVPYEAEVTTDAIGPRATNPSPRPGVIYYCVSSNHQEYWLTMTVLDADLGSTAKFRRAIQLNGEWFIHVTPSNFRRQTTSSDSKP